MGSACPVFKEARWIIILLRGLPSSQQDHNEGFVPAAMPQRLNGPTRQCKALHDIGSSQWLLVVPYSQRRRTKDSLPNPVRLYKWVMMPMGLTNVPATFMWTMNNLFKDMLDQGVVVFLDDMLIYSTTLEGHF